MNLLEKWSGIEIQTDSRISEIDRSYCCAHQKAHDTAQEELSELCQIWTDIVIHQNNILRPVTDESYESNQYISLPGISSTEIQRQIEALPDIFISRIVRYFNAKYHVSVDADPIKEVLLPQKPKYSRDVEQNQQYHRAIQQLSLRYEDILEQIFVQLGGRTFAEKAVEELKEQCHAAAWISHCNVAKYELKNDTIRFTFSACKFDDYIGRPRWSLEDSMRTILRGASYFETEKLGCYPAYISNLLGWDTHQKSVFEFSGDKLKQLRMFKNHRVDLKFTSKTYAHQFCTEYLGLVA